MKKCKPLAEDLAFAQKKLAEKETVQTDGWRIIRFSEHYFDKSAYVYVQGFLSPTGDIYMLKGDEVHNVCARRICKLLNISYTEDKSALWALIECGFVKIGNDHDFSMYKAKEISLTTEAQVILAILEKNGYTKLHSIRVRGY